MTSQSSVMYLQGAGGWKCCRLQRIAVNTSINSAPRTFLLSGLFTWTHLSYFLYNIFLVTLVITDIILMDMFKFLWFWISWYKPDFLWICHCLVYKHENWVKLRTFLFLIKQWPARPSWLCLLFFFKNVQAFWILLSPPSHVPI